jgi:hypothetical protein
MNLQIINVRQNVWCRSQTNGKYISPTSISGLSAVYVMHRYPQINWYGITGVHLTIPEASPSAIVKIL